MKHLILGAGAAGISAAHRILKEKPGDEIIIVSEDREVYSFIASLTGVFGWELFVSLALTNYLLKCAIKVIMTPATYLAVYTLKKAEAIDTYDVGISLNPFTR
jgi:NADPH-dependent 2,4-dienoyl-CoA reductase/sulfur reductase-like enzyme